MKKYLLWVALAFDAVFIRKSRVRNGEVVVPPGGLAYMEDTWGSAGNANIDLVRGQVRVAGQAILKDVGKALLERRCAAAAAPAVAMAEGPVTPALAGGIGVAALERSAQAFEFGRRRQKAG